MLYLRRKVFSENKEKRDKSALLSTGIGAALAAGGIAADNILEKKSLTRALSGKPISPEHQALLEDMVSKAEKEGLTIDRAIKGGEDSKFVRKSNTLHLNRTKNVASVANELGHAHYNTKDAGTFGRIVHKIAPNELGAKHHVGIIGSAVGAGVISGKRAAQAEIEGRKESKLNRNIGWLAPTALMVPTLIAEGLAARKGLKIAKNSNASKEALDLIKKDMGKGIGRYAATTAAYAGLGEATRGLSKRHYKKKYDKEISSEQQQ